jgi:RNA polymerase sigma factor (sigma-70 family)
MIATRSEMVAARIRPRRVLTAKPDRDLVEAVRSGDDSAFEELYRRYRPRIAAYVRRMVHDSARAEDLAQDAFFSALRRMRATDAEIAFKPWIFEIARNAAIDHWRRSSRAQEVSVDADDQLRQSDRVRLVGASGPDSALVDKERLEHLRAAFDGLSDVHTRILVMRELEGLSYREIAERLDLTRASVESSLFRARRRLESEYADISEGRRCAAMRTVMAHMAEGLRDKRDEGRLARHARRCHLCRRRARELGVEPLPGTRRRVAALLPLPLLPRRSDAAHGGFATGGHSAGAPSGLLPAGAQVSAVVAERAAAIVAAAALAGAGGMALGGDHVFGGEREPVRTPATEQRASGPDAATGGSTAAGLAESDGAAAQPHRRASQGAESGKVADVVRSGESGSASDGDTSAPRDGDGRGGRDAVGDADRPGGRAGAGDVGLPTLPGVPAEVGGGAPRPAPDAGPRLAETPAPPSVQKPAVPDVPLGTPGVESAPPAPVDVPAAPDLPAVDPGRQLDAVMVVIGG